MQLCSSHLCLSAVCNYTALVSNYLSLSRRTTIPIFSMENVCITSKVFVAFMNRNHGKALEKNNRLQSLRLEDEWLKFVYWESIVSPTSTVFRKTNNLLKLRIIFTVTAHLLRISLECFFWFFLNIELIC